MDFDDLKYIVRSGLGDKGSRIFQDLEYYYFNHIPKTGGTTLRYMLYEYFGGDNLYPNALEYFIKNKGQYLIWDEFEKRGKDIVRNNTLLMGHYDIKPLSLYPVSPKVFSFFRDPIDCVISSINYNRIRGRRYSNMTIDEILENELWREGSMQAKHMGYNRKEPNLPEVLKNIENLNCIGIAEQFERSVNLLNIEFSWNLKMVRSKNISKKINSITESQLEKINEAIGVDRQVYNFALSSFQRRCENYDL